MKYKEVYCEDFSQFVSRRYGLYEKKLPADEMVRNYLESLILYLNDNEYEED